MGKFSEIVMVSIPRLMFKTTGIMSNKEVVRTSKSIGKRIAEEVKSGNEITTSRIKELLTESIGRKNVNKIVISDKYEDFFTYMNSIGVKEESLIKQHFDGSASAVVLNPKTKSVLLSLRLKGRDVNESLNIIGHELEHVLNQLLTPRVKLESLWARLRGKNYMDKSLAKYGQLLNEKNMFLQNSLFYMLEKTKGSNFVFGAVVPKINQPPTIQGLLKHLSYQDKKDLGNKLNRIVKALLVNDYKTDKKILSMCKVLLKEESRAYKSGGAVERYWSELNGINSRNANNSEMKSLLYDEALKQVNKEAKKLRLSPLKRLLGIKTTKITYSNDA